jgi:hypothetical protein
MQHQRSERFFAVDAPKEQEWKKVVYQKVEFWIGSLPFILEAEGSRDSTTIIHPSRVKPCHHVPQLSQAASKINSKLD